MTVGVNERCFPPDVIRAVLFLRGTAELSKLSKDEETLANTSSESDNAGK